MPRVGPVIRESSLTGSWTRGDAGQTGFVTVGPVYWGSYSGETLERVFAVFMSQEVPEAIRRTPSSGDGGVDVLVELDEGWHVYQVKGFVGRLGSSRRGQIERSFEKVVEDPRLERPIARWSLAVPIDPTSDEQKWFEQLTDDAPFRCCFEGESYWHSLAAQYPYVVDYYLRDGRAAVERRAQALLGAAQAPSGPLSPLDVAGHLEQLRGALNREDPHYRYEFRTSAVAPEEAPPADGAVMAATSSVEDGGFMTVLVFPRHQYALVDSPIGGNLTLTLVEPDSDLDLTEAFEEFQTYGVGIDLPPGALDVHLMAPGGLGGTFEGGGGKIGPRLVDDPPQRTRLRAQDTGGGSFVELGLVTASVTRGDLGGVEFKASDESGVLQVVFRMRPPSDQGQWRFTIDLKLGEFRGRPVHEVMPAVRLAVELQPPNRLEWLPQYGSQVTASTEITEAPLAIPDGLVGFLENLSLIQDHVRDEVIVPLEIDESDVQPVAEVAHLLRHGEMRGTWTDLQLELDDDASPEDLTNTVGGGGHVVIQSDWVLELAGRQYDIGPVHQIAKSARLSHEQPEDGRAVRLVPDSSDEIIQRLGPVPDS